ncbi:MAG: hypothetical protein AAGA70_13945 [Pseudomonadota bacterium]
MFERLKDAIEAGRQAVSDTEATEQVPVVAWLVLDELNRDAERRRTQFLKAAQGAGARPLFILSAHSQPDHATIDRLCEFLPLPEDIAAATGERADAIARYQSARLMLILTKWGIKTCYWTGDRAGELIDGVAASDVRVNFVATG